MPKLPLGAYVDADVVKLEKFTEPPALLTEGTLITAMKTAGRRLDDAQEQAILKEAEGIGTEATRANIIDKLKNKKYLTVDKNNLTVSPSGKILCQAVASQPLLVSPEMTAKWEVALQQISQQTRTPENFLNQIKHFVEQIIANTPERLAKDTILQQQITVYKKKMAPSKLKQLANAHGAKRVRLLIKENFMAVVTIVKMVAVVLRCLNVGVVKRYHSQPYKH